MNERASFQIPNEHSLPAGEGDTSRHAVVRDGREGLGALAFSQELQRAYVRSKRRRLFLALGALASDLAAATIGLFVANLVYLGTISWDQSGSMVAVCLPIYLLFTINSQAHWPEYVASYWRGLAKALSALFFTAASMLFIAFSLKVGAEFSRGVFLLGLALAGLIIPVGRLAVLRAIASKSSPRLSVTLLIRDGVASVNIEDAFALDAKAYDLSPARDTHEAVRRLGELAKCSDRLIVACTPERRAVWADAFRTLDVPSEIIVEEFDQLSPIAISQRDGHVAVSLSNGGLHWDQKILKRSFDLAITIPGVILLVPVFLAIAVAIRLDSRGPVFFRQERIGLGNRSFHIWKFRSMRVDMQDPAGAKLTERNDDRVTRVGHFLRRTSLDELPQLFNVLSGEMSLVGPRPHAILCRAGESLYWEVDEAYWERHVVKPGITGLAQVTGFRGNTFHEDDLRGRLQADLIYAMDWSIWKDFMLLLRTFLVLGHKNAF